MMAALLHGSGVLPAIMLRTGCVRDYYHVARPHSGLDGDTPIPAKKQKPPDGPTKLISFPVCGGLH